MSSYNYNQQLIKCRNDLSLSRKECAKKIGISSFFLFLFETGYFHPRGKKLEKIESFYNTKIDMSGEKEYPGEIEIPTHKKRGKRKTKIIIFSSLILLSAVLITVGSILFNNSVNNVSKSYGPSYQQMREETINKGKNGVDLVTNLEYYYSDKTEGAATAVILFYKTNSILFFNECSYSTTLLDMSMSELGMGRFRYRFGGDLQTNSYICFFDYGGLNTGAMFSCQAKYEGQEFRHIDNFVIKVEGTVKIDEAIALKLFNARIIEAEKLFNQILNEVTGKDIDFYHDFLNDREIGRKSNYVEQIVGLSLGVPSIVIFFISLTFLFLILIKYRKTMLVPLDLEYEEGNKPLPKDIKVPFVIPDYLLLRLASIGLYVSFALIIFGFIGKLGIPFFNLFSNPTFMKVISIFFASMPFLRQFLLINSVHREKELFAEIVTSVMIYVFLAAFETLVFGVFDTWGYNFDNIFYDLVPGSTFQVVALQYLIYMFLFFQPKFIRNKNKKLSLVLWRSLSIIPLALLVGSIIASNSYKLFYGVEKNIYISFWFPSTTISISIVFVVFIYSMFFIRILLERKYGKRGTAYYLYGNRYALIQNLVYIGLIVFIFVLALILYKNEMAYYLNFTSSLWLLLYIPVILFAKSAPSTAELYLSEEIGERISE